MGFSHQTLHHTNSIISEGRSIEAMLTSSQFKAVLNTTHTQCKDSLIKVRPLGPMKFKTCSTSFTQ